MADEPSTLSITKVANGDKTITIASAEVMSAYLPIIFEVESSFAGNAAVVIATVEYHDGSDWVELGSQKKTEIDVSGTILYRFDFSSMLQTILSVETPAQLTFSNIITGGNDIVNRFRVNFGYVYTDTAGQIITQFEIISSEYWVANAVVPSDNALQNFDDWVIGTGGNKNFLSNIPNNTCIYTGEEVQLAFVVDNDVNTFEVAYEEYDLNGVPQGTQTLTATIISNRYGIIPINSLAILSNAANMSKVDVWIQNQASSQVSEKKTFIVKNQTCPSGTRIMWLNSLGGLDQYTFTGYKRVEKASARVTAKKPLPLTYARAERGFRTLGSQSIQKWTLGSTEQSEAATCWLDELNRSTDVMINEGFNFFRPIIVTSESVTTSDTFAMNNFVLTFDYSREEITHVG